MVGLKVTKRGCSRHRLTRIILIAKVLQAIFVGQVCGNWDIDARLVQGSNTDLAEALQFLKEYDAEASDMCFRVSTAQWRYATNMTEENKRRMMEEQTLKAKFDKLTWRKAITFDWTRIPDIEVKRQLRMLTTNTRASLTDDKFNELHQLITEMKELYGHVRVCPYVFNGEKPMFCDLELSDVQKIMASSRNHFELLHIWKEWHDKVGTPIKNRFIRYIQLTNQAARINGFLDAGEEMRFAYEDRDFDNDLAISLQRIQPLYKELLTYVRRKLMDKYGPKVVRPEGPLPAHILGNIWAQDWSNIPDIVLPYAEFRNFDVTGEMLKQGFTPLRMFQMAEEFFTSLGLKPMPPEFWRHSMLERPNGRRVQCTASAWDFCNKVDFRIKQCTEVDMRNLITVHHEMAHIEYYMYYADLPYLYRDGANPGFHEGVANAVILSVFNPIHFRRVGLFENNTDLYELNINFLMLMALRKVAYAPFAYVVDQWRYELSESGSTKMNSLWWDLRLSNQGIVPPVPRNEYHLDAASKRHIPADVPYTKYYVALLLEFQIHEAMCRAARFEGPLHECDVYRSREAGRVLIDILRNGKSRHWRDVIRVITRGETDKVSPDSMLRYFDPLLRWLKSQNRRERVIGWTTFKEDKALFEPLVYGGARRCVRSTLVIFMFVITVALNNLG
ncbi:unnamed protein product [Callosobruchus maculatus]|uniref:Angiotensin-converting enzyme n=2 Tax=Callosobruchus maculatus TaxID=64391 RepID=A0A653BZZ9_CALMS|nr:unnamed protein product [Callosobruchus maculatus]